jgi:hypothetical protein
MTEHNMTKEKWVGLFREIGLTDEQMHAWHRAFERQYPAAHQAFLEWLQVPDGEVRAIRDRFRA